MSTIGLPDWTLLSGLLPSSASEDDGRDENANGRDDEDDFEDDDDFRHENFR